MDNANGRPVGSYNNLLLYNLNFGKCLGASSLSSHKANCLWLSKKIHFLLQVTIWSRNGSFEVQRNNMKHLSEQQALWLSQFMWNPFFKFLHLAIFFFWRFHIVEMLTPIFFKISLTLWHFGFFPQMLSDVGCQLWMDIFYHINLQDSYPKRTSETSAILSNHKCILQSTLWWFWQLVERN